MELNLFNIKINVTKIQIAALVSAIIGLYLLFGMNNYLGIGNILVTALLLIKDEEELTMPDPIEHRENQLKTPTGKQLELKQISSIKGENIVYERMKHPDNEEAINVFYIKSTGGFTDVEVYDAYKRGDATALIGRYPHVVETRSIGVFRSNIRRNFLSYGTKGALNFLKRQGFNSDMISGAFETKKKNKKRDENE